MEKYLNERIVGHGYRQSHDWGNIIPEIKNYTSVKYLEIGVYYGFNLFTFGYNYGVHPDSEMHCIDPWLDYDDYSEYKNKQNTIYEGFLYNLENSGLKNKIFIHRGYSSDEIPKFENEYFDIIYVDGNHNPEYVLEDAVLSFRKLKKNGYLIFDDYTWNDTHKGIDSFCSCYHNKIKILNIHNSQMFIQKI